MPDSARPASRSGRPASPLAALRRRAARSARSPLAALAACSALAAGPIGPAAPARADILSLPASADTAPYSFLPSLLRFNNPALYAFESFDENGTPHDFETYLAFDVEQTDLPAGHVLVEATLLVTYAFDFSGFGEPSTAPGEIVCHEVLAAWNPTTLSWINRPDIDAPFDAVVGITDFGAILCDATPIVLAWITGQAPNHGIALTNTTERVIGMHALESSADPSLQPQLILRTELPEPATGLSLMAGASLLMLAGRSRARSRREALLAREGRHGGA